MDSVLFRITACSGSFMELELELSFLRHGWISAFPGVSFLFPLNRHSSIVRLHTSTYS